MKDWLRDECPELFNKNSEEYKRQSLGMQVYWNTEEKAENYLCGLLNAPNPREGYFGWTIREIERRWPKLVRKFWEVQKAADSEAM